MCVCVCRPAFENVSNQRHDMDPMLDSTAFIWYVVIVDIVIVGLGLDMKHIIDINITKLS